MTAPTYAELDPATARLLLREANRLREVFWERHIASETALKRILREPDLAVEIARAAIVCAQTKLIEAAVPRASWETVIEALQQAKAERGEDASPHALLGTAAEILCRRTLEHTATPEVKP